MKFPSFADTRAWTSTVATGPDASWSLITTAADYGRFVQAAVLRSEGLAEATALAWTRMRIQVSRGEIVRLTRAPEDLAPDLG